MPRISVIGAGVGGLAAAIDLASRGFDVDVYEALEAPGGRIETVVIDGARVGLGPATLVLPAVFDALLRAAGTELAREVTLLEPEVSWCFRFADALEVDLRGSREAALMSVETSLGRDAREGLAAFLEHAARVWSAAAPSFVYGSESGLALLRRLGPRALSTLVELDATRTLDACLARFVSSPPLRSALRHLALAHGFDPRSCPATVAVVAHVELTLGSYGVAGGMGALVDALASLAARLGVVVHTARRVASIETSGTGSLRRVTKVRLADGDELARPAVVFAAPPRLLETCLSGDGLRLAQRRSRPTPSAWTAVVRARRRVDRPARAVLVRTNDDAVLSGIFTAGALPRGAPIEVVSAHATQSVPPWGDEEALVVRVPMPPLAIEPPESDPPSSEDLSVREAIATDVMSALRAAGLVTTGDRVVWQRSVRDLALRFPGTLGALHGASVGDARWSWRRSGCRVPPIAGLYLASGDLYPAGSPAMAALAGMHAAQALAEDFGIASA